MNEGTIITFKDEGGLRISKDNTSITTGKVIVNGIEITSVEDWTKVTQSIVELQQKNNQLKEENKRLKEEYMLLSNASDEYEDKLQDRINKAVEYIESKTYQYGDEEQDLYDYDIGFDEVNDLLNLLKGDKE